MLATTADDTRCSQPVTEQAGDARLPTIIFDHPPSLRRRHHSTPGQSRTTETKP